jgi:hypothetical protein
LLVILGEQKAKKEDFMVFHSSPALRRIRQLARLIRRHPDLPANYRDTPWHDLELSGPEPLNSALPDPEQFVDSSVTCNEPNTTQGDTDMRRKHVHRPHSRAGQ